MALPADLSTTAAVSAETPIQDLSCIKVTQVGAAAFIYMKWVQLQSVPPETLAEVDRYEMAEVLRDFIAIRVETPAKRVAQF